MDNQPTRAAQRRLWERLIGRVAGVPYIMGDLAVLVPAQVGKGFGPIPSGQHHARQRFRKSIRH